MSHRPLPGRRSVLRGSLAASAALTLPTALGAAPAFARSGRPGAGWGVQTGDVTSHSGLVWVRRGVSGAPVVDAPEHSIDDDGPAVHDSFRRLIMGLSVASYGDSRPHVSLVVLLRRLCGVGKLLRRSAATHAHRPVGTTAGNSSDGNPDGPSADTLKFTMRVVRNRVCQGFSAMCFFAISTGSSPGRTGIMSIQPTHST